LHKLEEALATQDRALLSDRRKKAWKSGRQLLRLASKVAQHRTDAYRLMGTYYWLTNNQKRALTWWDRSIKEGERLGARLELARTYFEVGRRLLYPGKRDKTLRGISANGYLDRAGKLFEELDLQWDLDQLRKITSE
jgi:hypothetical protein